MTKSKSKKSARSIKVNRARKSSRNMARSDMTLGELQLMAKSKGIPFGGLSKSKLVKKINNYY